ncbi:MAG TPA: hypothetical protein VII06_41415 [Chloroflexota bacterium]|jgi:hypothetical protein
MAGDGKLNKNALAGKRGATATLTPHTCPTCNERVQENQLLVVMQHTGGKKGRTAGYHRACYKLVG